MGETPSEYLARIGRKGGKNRVKNQSAEERKEQARRAADARWGKLRELVDDIAERSKALEKKNRRWSKQKKEKAPK